MFTLNGDNIHSEPFHYVTEFNYNKKFAQEQLKWFQLIMHLDITNMISIKITAPPTPLVTVTCWNAKQNHI